MSWIPALLGAAQAGIGLYGQYKQHKYEKRAERRGPKEERTSLLNPEQQRYYDMINSILTGEGEQPQGGLLGETFSEEGFNKAYTEPAMRMFREEITPHIAETYSGAGAGAQRSSAFQNALAKSGSDLTRGLAELRQQQRLNAFSALSRDFMRPTEDITRKERHAQSPVGRGLAQFGAGGGSTFFDELTKWLQEKYGAPKTQQGSYIDKSGNITGPMY